jgi:hypothetical protein
MQSLETHRRSSLQRTLQRTLVVLVARLTASSQVQAL